MATTNARIRPYLLDLTRLTSRAGRGPLTGVDRVERAYLGHLLAHERAVFFLVRTGKGVLLLDRQGGEAFRDRIDGKVDWGARDLLAFLSPKLTPTRQRAEADLRRHAIARCAHGGLTRLLSAKFPDGFIYLNTGHSNLSDRALGALKASEGAEVHVLIHDTIPLDFPQFQAPGGEARFLGRLAAVSRHADRVIYNSEQSRRDGARQRGQMGRVPPQAIVAHLGVEPLQPDDRVLPKGMPPSRPYFVSIGTIEPRKNHALLLDLWDEMAADTPPDAMPSLLIIGSRGWNNAPVFSRLDDPGTGGGHVHELSDLSDGAMASLLAGAQGLLFPSFAEGFGLPLIEAASLGVPVVCAPHAVYEEFLTDFPVYVPLEQRYLWRKEIERLKDADREVPRGQLPEGQKVPSWDEHFEKVFALA